MFSCYYEFGILNRLLVLSWRKERMRLSYYVFYVLGDICVIMGGIKGCDFVRVS